MAEKQKEAVVEEIKDTTQQNEKQPEGKQTKGDITKVKAKMTKAAEVVGETITKVDLRKPPKKEES